MISKNELISKRSFFSKYWYLLIYGQKLFFQKIKKVIFAEMYMHLRRYEQKTTFSKWSQYNVDILEILAFSEMWPKKLCLKVISNNILFHDMLDIWAKISFFWKYWYLRICGQKTIISKWSQRNVLLPEIYM